MKIIYIVFFSAMSLFATAAETTPPPAEKVNALQVEILVFSGMPDPRFLITDAAVIKEIMDMAAALPAHATLKGTNSVIPKGRLGYRGIRIENVSSSSSEIEWFTIFRTNVEIVRKGATVKEFKADASAALERRLIQLAEQKNIMALNVLQHVKSGK